MRSFAKVNWKRVLLTAEGRHLNLDAVNRAIKNAHNPRFMDKYQNPRNTRVQKTTLHPVMP